MKSMLFLQGKLVTVLGKGGVGKSTAAIALSKVGASLIG